MLIMIQFDADTSFAIGKIDENTISISARGNNQVDVGMIMRKLEGGGNPRSAATKIDDNDLKKAERKLIKVIRSKYHI